MTKLKPQGDSLARQKWLEAGADALRKLIAKADHTVPEAVRVSVGWPKGSRGGHAIGQCWGPQASADGHAEIFISPELGIENAKGAEEASIFTLSVLAHELVHAAVGVEAKHKGPFKKLATAIGLGGKMTATVPEQAFTDWARPFIAKHGTFPGGKLTRDPKLKQTTRLLKCECPECGYVARVTAKWIEQAGAPICPVDDTQFKCDTPEEGEDD